MEFILLKGTHNKAYSLEPCVINDIIEHWTSVQVEAERSSPQDKYFCYLKGKLLGPLLCTMLHGYARGAHIVYPILVGYGYTPYTFSDVSKKKGYVLSRIHVSDTFGPDRIWPRAAIVGPMRPIPATDHYNSLPP
jgi:hypothetical protein